MTSVSSSSSVTGSRFGPAFRLSFESFHSLRHFIESYSYPDEQMPQYENGTSSGILGNSQSRRSLTNEENSNLSLERLESVANATERAYSRTSQTCLTSQTSQIQKRNVDLFSLSEINLSCCALEQAKLLSSSISEGLSVQTLEVQSPIEGCSRTHELPSLDPASNSEARRILGSPGTGRIRVLKDHWRKESKSEVHSSSMSQSSPNSVFVNVSKDHSTIPDSKSSENSGSNPEVTSTDATKMVSRDDLLTTKSITRTSFVDNMVLLNSNLDTVQTFSNIIDQGSTQVEVSNEASTQATQATQATTHALKLVRLAELDRQRVLYRSISPPKYEYHNIDDDLPPYHAQLHRYLDLVSYDNRFAPVLRVNRYLVHNERELKKAIRKFSKFNLIPKRTNLWTISHVDDEEYERMIPTLIPDSSY